MGIFEIQGVDVRRLESIEVAPVAADAAIVLAAWFAPELRSFSLYAYCTGFESYSWILRSEITLIYLFWIRNSTHV